MTFINCNVIESHNVLPEIENAVYDYIQNNNISNLNNNIIPNIINIDPNIRIPENHNREVRGRNNENINVIGVNQNINNIKRNRNSENKELSNKFSLIGLKIIDGDILENYKYKLNNYSHSKIESNI